MFALLSLCCLGGIFDVEFVCTCLQYFVLLNLVACRLSCSHVVKGKTRAMMRCHEGSSVIDPLEHGPFALPRFSHVGFAIRPLRASFVWFLLVILLPLGDAMSPQFCHLHAHRVGEALRPGPTPKFCTIAITNPTSIVSKPSVYQELLQTHSIDICTASETAATKVAQKIFSSNVRQWNFKPVWSTPVQEKTVRTDGMPSLRGQATGVAAFSHFPIRTLRGTIPNEVADTSRLLHCLVDCGGFEIQLLVMYGPAASGTANWSRHLFSTACHAASQFPIPYIILGDFNCNPWNIGLNDHLESLGLHDLTQLHVDLHGSAMPPTCRQVTRPDNALLSPGIARYLKAIQVLPDQHFDTHQVVLMQFDFHMAMQDRTRLLMPAPWADLAISYDFMDPGYQDAVQRHGTPSTIEEWGSVVEHAADFAYRCTQTQEDRVPWSKTQGIPKRFRGRCQPRFPTRQPPVLHTKVGRPGDFHPGEVCRRRTRDLIKQVRRLRSLFNRMLKFQGALMTPDEFRTTWEEWRCILRSRCMTIHFVSWCQQIPELGPPSLGLPDLDYVHTLLQLVQHQANDAQAFDLRLLRDMRKFHHHLDAKWAGFSHAHATMRDGFVAPFDRLISPTSRDVVIVPEDAGHFQVWCDDPEPFTCTQLAQVGEHWCSIISKTPHGLLVKPVERVDLSDCTVIFQEIETIDPRQICHRLQHFWQPFWEKESVPPDAPFEFQRFLDEISQLVPAPVVRMDDFDLWTQAIRSMKTHSARGVDAIAASEIKKLPHSALFDLMNIMNSYSDGFPGWFMVAITAPVPKTVHTPQVSEIRPITILAQLYRIWSRVLCKQLTCHLSRYMPSDITGLLIGRGALDSALRQQFLIETAHDRKLSLSGLCLDLIKCYNTVHRPRVCLLLRALGIPEAILEVWFQSLQRLCRLWIVQGTCGQVTPTVNGIPEGDSFSVICMIALDFLWVRMVRSSSPDSLLSAYADNISWAAATEAAHQHTLSMTRSFCEGSGMAVDWMKTWCWGTTPDALAIIQKVLHDQIPATRVQHVRNAMDLGSQMTYAGPPQLGKIKKRLDRARARLTRLTTMDVPLQSKSHLALGGVYPVAFYGIAMIPLGSQHVDTLRSATASALLGPCKSRNSALALAATPACLDPFEYVVLTVIRTIRRFLLHLSPHEVQNFLDIAARHDGQAHKCRGPAGTLKYWLLKLGWIVDRTGQLHVQHGIEIHLVSSSLAAITKWVRRSWQKEVLDLHCSRQSLRHLHFDFATTRRVIASFPKKQHAALISEISGAYQTERQKQSWAHDSDGCCVHCGQEDSRLHRLLECPATQDIRLRYQEVVSFLQDEGSILAEIPAIPLQPDDDLLLMLHQLHPEADIERNILGRLLTLIQQGLLPEIYTDGSLQHGDASVGRLASYGIVWDTCVLDAQRRSVAAAWISEGVRPTSFATLACARTTGEQSIHRSELYAIVRTCELLPCAIVHSDSASALGVAHRCQEARCLAALSSLQDFDLVSRLWVALQ